MAIPTYLFHILATVVVIGSIIGLFQLGQKLERLNYRNWANICTVVCFIVFFTGLMVAYVSFDDRTSGDLLPTLVLVKNDGKLETRKIITPYYNDIPIHLKIRGGFYIVDNQTRDTIQVVTAFYHFYGESSSYGDGPHIECELAPSQLSVVNHPPIAVVSDLPSRRYFKVSKSRQGAGRFATYILRKK